jgi:hypothetical protein
MVASWLILQLTYPQLRSAYRATEMPFFSSIKVYRSHLPTSIRCLNVDPLYVRRPYTRVDGVFHDKTLTGFTVHVLYEQFPRITVFS